MFFLAASQLRDADLHIFRAVFDVHPFAAAAFLRAFVSCSFGLLLFHAHTLLTWPTAATMSMEPREARFMELARLWLLLQLLLLAVQTPLRMEVQRCLFAVSTAQDTPDAVLKLKAIFASHAWQLNQSLGWIRIFLGLCGPLLLWDSRLLIWGLKPAEDGVSAGSSNLDDVLGHEVYHQLVVICSSNLL